MSADFREQIEDALIRDRFGIGLTEVQALEARSKDNAHANMIRLWLAKPETIALVDAVVKLHETEVQRVTNPNTECKPYGRQRKYEAAVRATGRDDFKGELGIDYSLTDVGVRAVEEFSRLNRE